MQVDHHTAHENKLNYRVQHGSTYPRRLAVGSPSPGEGENGRGALPTQTELTYTKSTQFTHYHVQFSVSPGPRDTGRVHRQH